MSRFTISADVCRAIGSRAVAGTLGAFAFASLATTALALVLASVSMTRADAVTTALMASSLIFAAISLTAFHARSARRVWACLAGSAVPLAALTWALIPGAPS